MNSTDANARQAETFEQWWKTTDYWAKTDKNLAIEAWQASRKATLEESAEIAEKYYNCSVCDNRKEIADAIRGKLNG